MAIEIVDFPSYKMVMFHNFPIAFCMFTRGYRALKEVVVDCGGLLRWFLLSDGNFGGARFFGPMAPWQGRGFFLGVFNHRKVMKSMQNHRKTIGNPQILRWFLKPSNTINLLRTLSLTWYGGKMDGLHGTVLCQVETIWGKKVVKDTWQWVNTYTLW